MDAFEAILKTKSRKTKSWRNETPLGKTEICVSEQQNKFFRKGTPLAVPQGSMHDAALAAEVGLFPEIPLALYQGTPLAVP